MSRRIVAVLSVKGGSGKTTLAACIAAELSRRGTQVVLVDADPQASLSEWHAVGGPLSELPLIADPSEKAAQKALEASKTATVMIDTGGAATKTLVAVLEVADVVLIPCRPSALDAMRAQQAISLVATVNASRKRKAKLAVAMNAATRSAMVGHIRNELVNAGVRVLGSEIAQRAAYAEAVLYGSAPCWMGKGAAKAATEIEALTSELMTS